MPRVDAAHCRSAPAISPCSYPFLADEWGYHIRPIHYYEPLPDFREISEARITRRRESPAIQFDGPGQVELVRRLGAAYSCELQALASASGHEAFDFHNPFFAGPDAAVYCALIRDLKPTHVIEIGAGYSSRIAARALQRNVAEGLGGRLTCIDPHPEPRLTAAELEMSLIQERVEDVDLEIFRTLGDGDTLFIDSSHSVKCGNDVCREFLEILPQLKPGVWIHVHDVFFPHDYPAEWLI